MLAQTCSASSRVGTSTRARTELLATGAPVVASSWSSGSANPAVLPVPVCAAAIRSRPARMAGIACVCTGVGVL